MDLCGGPGGGCDLRLLEPCPRKRISWQILTLSPPKAAGLAPPHHISRKLGGFPWYCFRCYSPNQNLYALVLLVALELCLEPSFNSGSPCLGDQLSVVVLDIRCNENTLGFYLLTRLPWSVQSMVFGIFAWIAGELLLQKPRMFFKENLP